MKKILCLIFAIVGISAYALPWEEASNNLMKFFDGGNAIYVVSAEKVFFAGTIQDS